MKKYQYIDRDGNVYEFTKEQAIAIRTSEGIDTTDGWKNHVWVKEFGVTKHLQRKLSKQKEELYFKKLEEWNKFNQEIWS